MKYKCLIIDHDDTVVDSTSKVHYPAYLHIMKIMRPDITPISLDEWFIKNFSKDLSHYLKDDLKFTEAEIMQEYKIWRSFSEKKVSLFYEGFFEFFLQFKKQGGIIAVVSYSDNDIILKDYNSNTNGIIQPDIILGRSDNKNENKPFPYPAQQILKKYNLQKEEAVIVDDIKPGIEMAHNAGIKAIGAGWAHDIEIIKSYMKKYCDKYFSCQKDFFYYIMN